MSDRRTEIELNSAGPEKRGLRLFYRSHVHEKSRSQFFHQLNQRHADCYLSRRLYSSGHYRRAVNLFTELCGSVCGGRPKRPTLEKTAGFTGALLG